MLNLHSDKNAEGVNRAEMGRSLVTTGRMATLGPSAISEMIFFFLVMYALGVSKGRNPVFLVCVGLK